MCTVPAIITLIMFNQFIHYRHHRHHHHHHHYHHPHHAVERPSQLEEFAKVAESAAVAAGKHIKASLERRAHVGLKIDEKTKAGAAAIDLVTEVDLQAEEVIIPFLKKAFPVSHCGCIY